MTVDDHFELVASVYDSLRTTDEAPVRRIRAHGDDLWCLMSRSGELVRVHPR